MEIRLIIIRTADVLGFSQIWNYFFNYDNKSLMMNNSYI